MKRLHFLLSDSIPQDDQHLLDNMIIGPAENNYCYWGRERPPTPYVYVTGWPDTSDPIGGLINDFKQDPGFLHRAGATEEIIEDLRAGRAYCMINIYAEGWVEPDLILPMHDYFNRMQIPLSQVIFHNNCANHREMYNKIIGSQYRINTSYSPQFVNDYMRYYHHNIENKSGPDKNIIKPFLCFNYHHHKHRVEFFARVVKAGLFEEFYWSMPRDNYKGTYEQAMTWYFPGIEHDCVDGLTYADVVFAQRLLPQVLEPNFSRRIQESGSMAPKLYSTSLVSVVTETFFHREEIHMTEKIYKAIAWQHPFVLVSTPGSLAYLRSMGFRTFHDFWDEHYDLETDHTLRMNKIIDVLKHIASWDRDTQVKFLVEAQPIIQHNAQQLLDIYNRKLQGQDQEYQEFLEKYGEEMVVELDPTDEPGVAPVYYL
jgi:hypothetical protein